MKMDGNIRVFTDVRYKELYNNMKNSGAVEDSHELFFLCSCLGYKKGNPISITKRDERFWSRTITTREWACYYAMVLEKNCFAYEKVSDDKDVLAIIEGYANAGMEILIDEFLGDFLLSNTRNTNPQLDSTFCKELTKQFVHFIFEQAESDSLGG